MNAPTDRRALRRGGIVLAATAMVVVLTVGPLAGLGAALTDVIVPTTTTTVPGQPVDPLGAIGGVAGPLFAPDTTTTVAPDSTTTSTTVPETTTTSSTSTTTTTTAPAKPFPFTRTPAETPASGGTTGRDEGTATRQPAPVAARADLPELPGLSGPATAAAERGVGPTTGPSIAVLEPFGGLDVTGPLEPLPSPDDLLDAFRPAAGPRSTAGVLDALGTLGSSAAVLAQVLAPFPVAGPASYSDDWHGLRLFPTVHAHEGTDIFAARGTPVIASAAGTVTNMTTATPVGGTSLRLTTADRTYYYYAHLDRFSPSLVDGMSVAKGEVLGYVGNTGDAAGGPTHLHFEVHPGGGEAISPVPLLDQWLADALERAGTLGGGNLASVSTSAAAATSPGRSSTPLIDAARRLPSRLARTNSGLGRPEGFQPVVLGLVVLPMAWLAARRRRRPAA